MKYFFSLFIFLFSFLNTPFAQSLLDPSFGDNGIVKANIGSTFNYPNYGKQVLLQPDGSIYLIFEGNYEYATLGFVYPTIITKILPNGTTDISYGNMGFSTSVPIFNSYGAIQPDGKIIIAGTVNNYNQYDNLTDFAIVRLNSDGSRDSTFNGDGIQITDLSKFDYVNSVTIQADGKIVVGGSTTGQHNFIETTVVLARYNPDGSLDQTFNGTGIISASLGSASSIAMQEDGKIVVVAQQSNHSTVIRYNNDGSLDATFTGTWPVMFTANSGFANLIAVQSDGKIVAAGYIPSDNDTDYAIVRLNANGSPDNTFNGNGFQTTDFGNTNDVPTSIAVQSDGRIILAGSSSGTTSKFALCRYNSDGSLDNTFHTDGKQTTNFGSLNSYANSIAIQNDGKLVALGYETNGITNYIAAARYNSDGNIDTFFGESGMFVDHVEQGDTHFTATVIQNDGKIVTSGYSWNGSDYDFILARYYTNGALDNSFGTAGKLMTDFGSTDDKARAMVIQNDGKFLLAGSAGGNFAIARYNSDGILDNTFGINGMQITNVGSLDSANSIILQNDGKILVGGTLSLVRYNTDGSLDMSFKGVGKVVLPFICYNVAIQGDAKIVISGTADNRAIVARYNSDGFPDSTFGSNGILYFLDPQRNFYQLIGKSIKIENDGTIVIGGYYESTSRDNYSSFAVLKVTNKGTPDSAFGNNGLRLTGLTLNYATSMAIEEDGKIILAGYSYNGSSYNFTIMRLNADGSADNTFSEDGAEITDASSANNRISGIALGDGKLYAVGYGQYPGNLGVIAKYIFSSGVPLPVALSDFTAVLHNNQTTLQWQTASEYNLSHFSIERSGDGYKFITISKLNAFGNSNKKVSYSTIDYKPLQGFNYYRLKLVDIDGKLIYSKIISVNNNSPFTFQIHPNPANNILLIQTNGNSGKAIYQIVNMMGKKLKEESIILSGFTLYPIDIATLSKGAYIINLQTKTRKESIKFIKN